MILRREAEIAVAGLTLMTEGAGTAPGHVTDGRTGSVAGGTAPGRGRTGPVTDGDVQGIETTDVTGQGTGHVIGQGTGHETDPGTGQETGQETGQRTGREIREIGPAVEIRPTKEGESTLLEVTAVIVTDVLARDGEKEINHRTHFTSLVTLCPIKF